MFVIAASIIIGSGIIGIQLGSLADAIHDLCEVVRRGGHR